MSNVSIIDEAPNLLGNRVGTFRFPSSIRIRLQASTPSHIGISTEYFIRMERDAGSSCQLTMVEQCSAEVPRLVSLPFYICCQ